MLRKRILYERSAIPVKPIPYRYRQKMGALRGRLPAVTKGGDLYTNLRTPLANRVSYHVKKKYADWREKYDTVMAYVNNYFVMTREVPSFRQLERRFPFLKNK